MVTTISFLVNLSCVLAIILRIKVNFAFVFIILGMLQENKGKQILEYSLIPSRLYQGTLSLF